MTVWRRNQRAALSGIFQLLFSTLSGTPSNGTFFRHSTHRAIWTHGGPSSAFLHILMALALLIPRLLLESKMIQTGLLPKGKRVELSLVVG